MKKPNISWNKYNPSGLFLKACLFLYFLTALNAITSAQQGKTGSLTVTTAVTVNEYTRLAANASAGNTSITVSSSSLNTHSRFAKNLSEGDLVMIIQMQGTSILSGVTDSTWGKVTNYNNCGNYEVLEVQSVPSATTIKFSCGLVNNYTASGNVQVVRIPRYSTLTVNAGGSITGNAWNGQTGGIVAIEVLGATVINGTINAGGIGFRGGQLINMGNAFGETEWATTAQSCADKGEGIAGYQLSYNTFGGEFGRGAAANGGGGGDGWNAGGGGGANGGDITAYNSNGNPDVSTGSWATEWNLEYPGFAGNTSSGGGKGGYTAGFSGPDPATVPPGNSAWTPDSRRNVGGKGGRPLDYSTGRLFLGGGGGAGHEDNNSGSAGAIGGGLVYMVTYSTVSGSGQIVSNGNNAAPANQSFPGDDDDAAGGGGGGGTIIINSTGTVSGISCSANGGAGGDQVVGDNPLNEFEGPGGGGGGGYVAISNAGVTTTVSNGANGTTDAAPMSVFPPNGATAGGAGSTGSVTNFTIIPTGAQICKSGSASVSATLSSTVPGGTTIEWYDSLVGGSLLGSGTNFTTPVLTQTTVFYVGTCPGTYRVPVTVKVEPFPVTIQPVPAAICNGKNIVLHASGATSYQWAGTTNTTDTIVAHVTSATIDTTYKLQYTSGGCTADTPIYVSIAITPTLTITGPPAAICASSLTTLTATGGANYVWGNGATTNAITVSPTTDSTFFVYDTNSGCAAKDSIKILVNPLPVPTISSSQTICSNSSVPLLATGGITYAWSPAAGLSDTTIANPIANPTVTTKYIVLISNGICSTKDSVVVTVNPIPTATACCDSTIALGQSIGIVVSSVPGTGTTFSWTPTVSLSCDTCPDPVATPTSTTKYYVYTTLTSDGCTAEDSVLLTVTDYCAPIYMPDAFSPNGDGHNDILKVYGGCIKAMDLIIYDRWGNKVFESIRQSDGWDGTYKGKPMNTGSFAFYLVAKRYDGTAFNKKGSLVLVR